MSSEFCILPEYIFENVIEEIIQNFDLEKMKSAIESSNGKRYNLVITGSIGVGKSTISQILSIILKKCCEYIDIYPEYISIKHKNRPIGNDIFDMFMDKQITSSTFQNFVIDIWKTMFEKNDYNTIKDKLRINIFERLPHDAVFCFTKEQVGKTMSQEEYATILTKYQDLIESLDIPTYDDCYLKNISNDSKIYNTIIEILKIIYHDIITEPNITRVIGLTVSNEKYKQRIKQRGRESEENYDIKTLDYYNRYYEKLFQDIETKTFIIREERETMSC